MADLATDKARAAKRDTWSRHKEKYRRRAKARRLAMLDLVRKHPRDFARFLAQRLDELQSRGLDSDI